MNKYKETPECSKCTSRESITFAAPRGQGIRCKECGHEKLIVKPKKGLEIRVKYQARIKRNWGRFAKKDTF